MLSKIPLRTRALHDNAWASHRRPQRLQRRIEEVAFIKAQNAVSEPHANAASQATNSASPVSVQKAIPKEEP
jgi:hypothetical protein